MSDKGVGGFGALAQPKLPRGEARPIGLRKPAKAPTGPRLYSGRPERKGGGAGEPPPGFMRATTSGSEWIFYVALAKALNDPPDPRQPPYFGGASWGYQIPIGGTYTRQAGTAVADYVVYRPRWDKKIILRLQTRRFHEGFGPSQQGYDVLQKALLGKHGDVIDIFEGSFLDASPREDPFQSNAVLAAAVVVAKEALSLIERLSPIAAGTSQARG